MVLDVIPYYTYEDYKHWEGDWELIKGIPYAMAPSPFSLHQVIAGRIYMEIEASLEDCEKCFALIEEDWIVSKDTVLKPDVMVVCNDNLYANVKKTPKLIVEVISKSTQKKDEELKFSIYEKEGVSYYIIVYPEFFKAKVFKLNSKYEKVGDFFDEVVEFEIDKCQIKIDFKRVYKKIKRYLSETTNPKN